MPKEEALQHIQWLFGEDLECAIVAEEDHEDGTPHLHAVICLSKRWHTRNASVVLDTITDKHGNYQAVRNFRNSVKYVAKDGHYVTYKLDVEAILKKQGGKFAQAVFLLAEGKQLEDLPKDYLPTIAMHKRKLDEFIAWCDIKRTRAAFADDYECLVYEGVDLDTQIIVDWLNRSIKKQMAFKATQLWIASPPNYGKTSLINLLSSHLSIYMMPLDEEYYDAFNDQDYDLVVLDEYKAHKTIQFINLWSQGGQMTFKKKGSQGIKKKNLPFIILSNYTPQECYTKSSGYALAPLLTRFLVKNLSKEIDIPNIVLKLKSSHQ